MEKELLDKLDLNVPSAQERSRKESEIRTQRASNRLSFGVNYLDKALARISKKDLILLGAATGCGKTELAIHIAAYNATLGKRVLFFALEAEECEVESRIKYKIAARKYFNAPSYESGYVKNFTYRNWYNDALGSKANKYIDYANDVYHREFKNLHTIYREKDFYVKDFQKYLLALYKSYDLIIVDHFNYFDFEDNKNENQAMTEVIKRIRDTSLLCGVPILLLAQLRKLDKRVKQLVPDIDDFHGSSNLTKICTKVIVLAPDISDEVNVKDVDYKYKYKTYFRIPKFRVDGAVNRYIARCSFDIRTNRYDDKFEMGKLDYDGKTFNPITDTSLIPNWACDYYENKK